MAKTIRLEEQITRVHLKVTDDLWQLRYYNESPTNDDWLASLTTPHESEVKADFEATMQLPPDIAKIDTLVYIDLRTSPQPCTWFTK